MLFTSMAICGGNPPVTGINNQVIGDLRCHDTYVTQVKSFIPGWNTSLFTEKWNTEKWLITVIIAKCSKYVVAYPPRPDLTMSSIMYSISSHEPWNVGVLVMPTSHWQQHAVLIDHGMRYSTLHSEWNNNQDFVYMSNPVLCKIFTARSREVSKYARFMFRLYNRFEILQAHRYQSCRDACQITERRDHYNTKSRGFETSRELTVRRPSAQ